MSSARSGLRVLKAAIPLSVKQPVKDALGTLVPHIHRRALYLAGEVLASVSRTAGRWAAPLLFRAQWGFDAPEWFDARLSLLYPEKWFTDGSHVSRANIIGVLPIGGTILDLCGGDGFLPFYAYSRRARRVVSVDHNRSVHRHALRHHAKPNIEYILSDVFAFDPGEKQFDVVAIRGALEHFTEPDQLRICRIAWRSLRPGGWFCGDVPLNAADHKLLSHHENEWASEEEARRLFLQVFPEVHTSLFQSGEAAVYSGSLPAPNAIRTTLLWRCQKPTN